MKNFRIKHGLTQRQFAKMLGVSRGTYSCLEIGIRQPNLKNRIKILFFYIKFYLGFIRIKKRIDNR